MDEMTRQRMVWTALVTSIGFLVASLVLAAFGAVTRGWYAFGAAVYVGAFVVAIVAWLAKPEAKPWVPTAKAEAAPPAPRVRSELRERIIYTTPHGDVVERRERGPAMSRHGFIVEREPGAARTQDVEQSLDRAAARPGKEPSVAELDAALRRWGRVHEGVG